MVKFNKIVMFLLYPCEVCPKCKNCDSNFIPHIKQKLKQKIKKKIARIMNDSDYFGEMSRVGYDTNQLAKHAKQANWDGSWYNLLDKINFVSKKETFETLLKETFKTLINEIKNKIKDIIGKNIGVGKRYIIIMNVIALHIMLRLYNLLYNLVKDKDSSLELLEKGLTVLDNKLSNTVDFDQRRIGFAQHRAELRLELTRKIQTLKENLNLAKTELGSCNIISIKDEDTEIKIKITKLDCNSYDRPMLTKVIIQYLINIISDSDVSEIQNILKVQYNELYKDRYQTDKFRQRTKKEQIIKNIGLNLEFGGESVVVILTFDRNIKKIFDRILNNKYSIKDRDVRGGISFSDGNVEKKLLGLRKGKERDRLDRLKKEERAIKIGDDIYDMLNNISQGRLDSLVINKIFDPGINVYQNIKDYKKTNDFSVPRNAPLESNDGFEHNLMLNTYKCNQGYSIPQCSQNNPEPDKPNTTQEVKPSTTQGYEKNNWYPLHFFNLPDAMTTGSPVGTTGSPVGTTGSP